jgi:hypothetical protein
VRGFDSLNRTTWRVALLVDMWTTRYPDALPRFGPSALERLRQNEIARRSLTREFLEERVRQTLELDEVIARTEFQ